MKAFRYMQNHHAADSSMLFSLNAYQTKTFSKPSQIMPILNTVRVAISKSSVNVRDEIISNMIKKVLQCQKFRLIS